MATIHTNLSNSYKVLHYSTMYHRPHNFNFKRNGVAEVPICVGVNLTRLDVSRLQHKMPLKVMKISKC